MIIARLTCIWLLFTALSTAVCPNAHACLCITKHRTGRLTDIANYACIFTGRVVASKGRIHTIVVQERFKGVFPDTLYYNSSGSCSLYMDSVQLAYSVNMLIYAESIDDDRMIDTHMCSGSRFLMKEPENDYPDLDVKGRYDAECTELDLLRTWRDQAGDHVMLADMAEEIGGLKHELSVVERRQLWLIGGVGLLLSSLTLLAWRTRKGR